MKKTHWIELLRNIRENKIAFCAIVLFIALGIAVFISFSSSGNSFLQSVNTMVRDQKLSHFEVFKGSSGTDSDYSRAGSATTLGYNAGGITDSDVDDCAEWDEIDKAEGKIEGFSSYKWKGKNCNARLNSITEKLDRLSVEEGKLPDKDDEVAVEMNYAENKGITVGDKISFTSGKEDSLLKDEDFTVSAIVKSPAYFSRTTITYGMTRCDSKPVDGVFYFDEDAFMIPYYTSVLLYSKKLAKLDTFSDEYKNKSDKIKKHLEKNIFPTMIP